MIQRNKTISLEYRLEGRGPIETQRRPPDHKSLGLGLIGKNRVFVNKLFKPVVAFMENIG